MKANNFRELAIWKKGMEIVRDIYILTQDFPNSEIYGITAQMCRCGVSIPSNIAEGFNRYHSKEFRQFLYVSLGSCAELETQIEISIVLGYLNEKEGRELLEKIDHISRMITSLSKKLYRINE
jgi:four helix bundle protein